VPPARRAGTKGAIIPHEAFDEVTLAHNLALLKTATPLQFSQTVQPICFPCQSSPVATAENCKIPNGSPLSPLQKLSVVDINPCPLPRIMATECCGHREGGNASGCLGHAGNPVMCQTTEARQWVLTGVLSKGGARCYGPFLYTRVSYYSDWIVSTTARCGSPTSPIVGSRGHAGFRAPAEGHGEIPDPLLNSANFPEDDSSLPDTRQSGENGQERPSLPGAPRALPNPLYYDYYSGEEIPISMGMPGQPGGLRGPAVAPS
uniref:Serine protease 54 n=1 Tax=Varanus komodoensis TaxID=61221 RepID=A0A8D2L055_VARKO